MRLMVSPPLTYRPKNHIPMAESISFSNFSHFSSFSFIFHFDVFLAIQMLGFCRGKGLDENLTIRRGRNMFRNDFG